MNQLALAVVILNWNGKDNTLECLGSIFKHSDQEPHVIVVDNASSDDSISVIGSAYPQVNIIKNSRNLGFAGGNNRGIEWVLNHGFSQVALLNNDTTIAPDTFKSLVAHASKHSFALASPKIYFYPDREFHHDSYKKSERGKVIWYAGGRIDWANIIASHVGVDEVDHGQFDVSRETDFATGCCLLIQKQVIQKIGLLDTSFKAYYEDTDYCVRARKAGFRIGYVAKSHLWHKNAGSTGGSGSVTQSRLVDQSRFTFAMRYAPWRAKLALIKQHWLRTR